MTLPAALWNHRHVSERESAHYWEDGRWDNAAWEDCFWDSLIEFLRDTIRTTIPASHDEAEDLRADSGEDTYSGSNAIDGNRGIAKRYGLPALRTFSDTEAWAALKPGYCGTFSGSMGVFPLGSRWRRHDPDFASYHRVYAARLDATDRVWWCDPLAAAGYEGEWMPGPEFRRFLAGFPGGDHFIGKLLPKPVNPAPDPTPVLRVRVRAGSYWQYDVHGNPTIGYDATTRVSKTTAGFSATYGKRIDAIWHGAKREWVHIIDGAYADTWVDLLDTLVDAI